MLYQVATAQLAAYDIARPLRGIFRHNKTVEVRHTGVTSIDPDARSVTTALGSSHHRGLPGPGTWRASELLRYAGSGRALPSALLGERCRTTARPHSRGPGCHHRTPRADREGCAELRDRRRRPHRRRNGRRTRRGSQRRGSGEIIKSLAQPAQVHLVDHGDVLLAPFSDKAHAYAAKRLEDDGVTLHHGGRRQRGVPRIGSCSAMATRS